ncbi:MAG: biopolymer transporter ExbD [Spirochaetes bacterium]|nr:biopolymer transporter ExbD [Spirochaetota bacterium]MBX3722510.1 biopolymer transporter ExbD [Turneriella sp.]
MLLKRKRLTLRTGIELAPFVDILFLLVTYFLMNATLANNPSIKIELPKSDTSQAAETQPLMVLINQENQIFVNEKNVALKDLGKTVADLVKDKEKDQVIIRGDKRSSYQMVISVMDELNKAGVTRFNLATDK